MEIYDLDSLNTDTNQNGLYDLTQITFNSLGGYQIYQYVVEPHETMRIDMVCNSIYGSVDYCDFILDINSIDNPLNIKSGDVIYYVQSESIDDFKQQAPSDEIKKTLLNINKTTRKDNNRQQYIDDNYSMRPTYLETPQESVQVVGSQIVIGKINE